MAEKKTPVEKKTPAAKPAAKAADHPAENVVALVAEQPAESKSAESKSAESKSAESKKKRGRPAAPASTLKRGRKSGAGILFMVETEEGSGLYERREALASSELMDIMDANRKVVATRKWREFDD